MKTTQLPGDVVPFPPGLVAIARITGPAGDIFWVRFKFAAAAPDTETWP
jgi:hypothetical protein